MQWYPEIKKRNKGFVSLGILLLILLLAGVAQGLVRLAVHENAAQQQYLRRRQLVKIATGLLETTQGVVSAEAGSTRFLLPTVTLYPGQEKITPEVSLVTKPEAFLQFTTVSFTQQDGTLWQLRQTRLEPPGGRDHPVYQTGYYSKAEGGTLTLPSLPQAAYYQAARHELPVYLTLRERGLEGFLYANYLENAARNYEIPAWTTLSGSGVIYNARDIKIGMGTKVMGRLWLLSGGNLTLADNVKLSNVLLFSTGDIYLGRNASICGIIVAAGKITCAPGAKYQVNKAVLASFSTPYFNY